MTSSSQSLRAIRHQGGKFTSIANNVPEKGNDKFMLISKNNLSLRGKVHVDCRECPGLDKDKFMSISIKNYMSSGGKVMSIFENVPYYGRTNSCRSLRTTNH